MVDTLLCSHRILPRPSAFSCVSKLKQIWSFSCSLTVKKSKLWNGQNDLAVIPAGLTTIISGSVRPRRRRTLSTLSHVVKRQHRGHRVPAVCFVLNQNVFKCQTLPCFYLLFLRFSCQAYSENSGRFTAPPKSLGNVWHNGSVTAREHKVCELARSADCGWVFNVSSWIW